MTREAFLRSLSATTILLRTRKPGSITNPRFDYEVLMQKRGKSISRSGMFTFPGGMYEPSDNCMRVTAMRELFEETGILLSEHDINPTKIKEWQDRVHTDASQFHQILRSQMQRSQVSSHWTTTLRHFCTFITPTFEQRKYTTMFFLAHATDRDCATLHADGYETASVCWVDPEEALALNAKGEMGFLPPQFYVMNELSAHKTLQSVMDSYRPIDSADSAATFSVDKVTETVDCRGFPPMQPVLLPDPVPLPDEVTTEGNLRQSTNGSTSLFSALTLPHDEAHPEYPGPVGTRHRVYCPAPFPPGRSGFVIDRNV